MTALDHVETAYLQPILRTALDGLRLPKEVKPA